MKLQDQVDALRAKGVAAAAMDSSQSREAWLETCKKLRSEELNLLYEFWPQLPESMWQI